MELRQKLILASGSPRRVDLLKQAGIEPARLMPMDLDETPKKSEHPRTLARRLSADKAGAAYQQVRKDLTWGGSYIIAADTVVAVGRRILPKVEDEATLRECMALLSGRRHKVLTGVALAAPGQAVWAALLSPQGKWLADFPGLAHQRLAALGITGVFALLYAVLERRLATPLRRTGPLEAVAANKLLPSGFKPLGLTNLAI